MAREDYSVSDLTDAWFAGVKRGEELYRSTGVPGSKVSKESAQDTFAQWWQYGGSESPLPKAIARSEWLRGFRKGRGKNPIVSPAQWGLMQAARKGIALTAGISKRLASEMVHKTPRKKRKKFARGKNPKEDLSAVEQMSRKFHGREPTETIEVDEVETFDPHQAVIGELHEIGVLSGTLDRFLLRFKHDKPLLTCNAEGTNLEIIGGDQSLETDEERRVEPLGFAYMIVYETDKHHLDDSDGQMSLYEHFFGEEFYKTLGFRIEDYQDSQDYMDELIEKGAVAEATAQGYLPMVTYDWMDEKLSLIGGMYTVEDVGIKD